MIRLVFVLLIIIYQCNGYKLPKYKNVLSSALVSISLLGFNQESIALEKLVNLSNDKIAKIVSDDITQRYYYLMILINHYWILYQLTKTSFDNSRL